MQIKKARLEEQLVSMGKGTQSSAPEGAIGMSYPLLLPNVKDDIRYEIVSDLQQKCTQLNISVIKNGWILKGIILENEQLFNGNGGLHYQMQSTGQNTI